MSIRFGRYSLLPYCVIFNTMASNVGEGETSQDPALSTKSGQQDEQAPVTLVGKGDPNIIVYDEDHDTWRRQLRQILSSDVSNPQKWITTLSLSHSRLTVTLHK